MMNPLNIRTIFWITIISGGIAGSLYMDYNILHIHVNLTWHIILFAIGLILLRIILYISAHVGSVLKEAYKKIKGQKTIPFVREDAYSCMRHPMHLGLLLLPESIGLMMGSPSFIFIIAPIIMILIIIITKIVDEKEAEKIFGEEYIKYKKEVPMFSLSPACLKYFFHKKEK